MCDERIRYQAVAILGDWRIAAFREANFQGLNSIKRIKGYGMTMTSNGNLKSIDSNPFDENTIAIPIRICSEEEVRFLDSDWCMNASPIRECHFDLIPRWWPLNWIYNGDDIPKEFTIDLGTLADNIVVDCVILDRVPSDVKMASFADIIFEGDIEKGANAAKQFKEFMKENQMFGKKKNASVEEVKEEPSITLEEETVTETVEEPVQENTSDVISEKVNSEEQSNVEDGENASVEDGSDSNNPIGGQKMAEEKLQEVPAKKCCKKQTIKLIGIGAGIGVVLGVGGTLLVQKIVNKGK